MKCRSSWRTSSYTGEAHSLALSAGDAMISNGWARSYYLNKIRDTRMINYNCYHNYRFILSLHTITYYKANEDWLLGKQYTGYTVYWSVSDVLFGHLLHNLTYEWLLSVFSSILELRYRENTCCSQSCYWFLPRCRWGWTNYTRWVS